MLKRIFPEELKLGMFIDSAVAEKGTPESKQVKFLDNYLIDTPEKLKKYRSLKLKYLLIDTDRCIEITEPKKVAITPQPVPEPTAPPPPVLEAIVQPAPEQISPPIEEVKEKQKSLTPPEPIVGTEPTPFEEELKNASEIKQKAHFLVKSYMEDVRMGRPLKPEAAKVQAKEIVDSLFRNDDALVSLTRLKSFDEYTFTHSVNVAVLISSFSKRLGFIRVRLENLAVGGILHDVGKAKIPIEILNKPGPLTTEEREIIKKHPIYSVEFLDQSPEISSDSKRIALEHHERLDGKGYPNGKTIHELHIDSNIASICDVYDAMTSARVYKPGMPLPQAIQFLLDRAGTEFKRNLLEVFVQHIGVYPVGSLVELTTGEISVVRQIEHEDMLKPHVIMVSDKYKRLIEKPIPIFLGDTTLHKRAIVNYLDPLQYNIDPNKYLETVSPNP